MLHNQDDIEKLFQDSFDGFEATPADHVKKNIDAALFDNKVVGKRRGILWIAFAVLLLGVFALIILFQNNSKSELQSGYVQAVAEKRNEIVDQNSADEPVKNSSFKKHQSDQFVAEKKNSEPENEASNGTSAQKNYSITEQKLSNKGSINAKEEHENLRFAKNEKQKKNTEEFNPEKVNAVAAEQNTKQVGIDAEELNSEENRVETIHDFEQLDSTQEYAIANLESTDVAQLESDSTTNTIANELKLEIDSTQIEDIVELEELPQVKTTGLWSVGLFTSFEQERPNAIDDSGIGSEQDTLEFGAISTSIYDFRFQIERRLTQNVTLGSGIAYAFNNVTQAGRLYITFDQYQGTDTVYVTDTTGSVVDTNYVDVYTKETNSSSYSNSYQLNQFTLPIFIRGFHKWGNLGIGLTAGIDLSFSTYKALNLNANISSPKHQSFGASAWLRPEMSYQFGQFEIAGFASMRSRLTEQLNWDFINNRRASFGGGIALRYYLR